MSIIRRYIRSRNELAWLQRIFHDIRQTLPHLIFNQLCTFSSKREKFEDEKKYKRGNFLKFLKIDSISKIESSNELSINSSIEEWDVFLLSRFIFSRVFKNC